MILKNSIIILIACLLFISTAKADIRVLIRFDSSGHFVHQIFSVARQENDIASKKVLKAQPNSGANMSVSPIERGRSWRNAEISSSFRSKQTLGTNGFARLTWYDLSGVMLAQTEVPDPRVVHSPSHIDGFAASWSSLSSGAWLVSGPESAVTVKIILPESTMLGLATEYWNLELNR